MRRVRTGKAVAALACVALLGTGCSLFGLGGTPPRPAASAISTEAVPIPHATPAGFKPVTAGRVRLAMPPRWVPEKAPEGWSYAAALRSRAVMFVRAGVLTKVPQAPDGRIVVLASTSALEMSNSGVRTGSKRFIQIPGAKAGVRVDYTFDSPETESGRTFPGRGADIAVVYDSGKGDGSTNAVVVRVLGVQSQLSERLIDQVVGTIAVGGA